MGAVCSKEHPGDSQSRAIDKQLAREEKMAREVKKLLLLGAGECGKSTILKQVRIAHDDTWKQDNRDVEKGRIFSNIFRGMADLCTGVEQLHMLLTKEMEDHCETLKAVIRDRLDMMQPSEDSVLALKALWLDETIRKVYEQRSQLQVTDSVAYFLDALDRITASGYVPTNEDYLHLRIPTTGVVEHPIVIQDAPFLFIDVGGQRAERRKWMHQFEAATSIIFISAVSEFDQVLNENKEENRLLDSLSTYSGVVTSLMFSGTPMIIFLNKIDLFREKLEVYFKSIKVAFPAYRGIDNYEDSLAFIEQQFLDVTPLKRPYMHRTCATDSDQVQKVIGSVVDAIITDTLKKMGIV